MALELNLIKNTNETLQGTLGKYYARVEYKGTIGVRELADHMHHHNTAFSKGIITGVLGDMVDCIKELVLNGYTVKIDDLGIFKASVDANGLTLEQGSKISAGRGAQRSDEALADNPALQQFAVGDVKMIMQATGATTIENMNDDARLSFTSKTKAMVKALTGSDAEESNTGTNTNNGSQNGGGTNGGGTNGGGGGDNGLLNEG
jgi:predicted histone-like DNA-binding protein